MQVYAPEVVTAGTVPNVIGLSEDEAVRVLSDAGVPVGEVRTHVVADVGPAGLVVSQSPQSGVDLEQQRVSLEISGPALMPDLGESSEEEAKEALSALGARVSIITEYAPGTDEGSVLSTDPPAGETIVDKATLYIAEPRSSVYVTQLAPAEASCRTAEPGAIAGEEEEEAVICLVEPGANPRAVTYELGGEVESFEAELGLDDGGNASGAAELRVLVDGKVALSQRVQFGEAVPIEVPVLGKFQLGLEAEAIGPGAPGSSPLLATFGEPRLVGSRSAIDRIAEGLGE